MPSSHKPCPAYKPSGIEWLGEVPEHWEVKRLKYALKAPLAYGVLKPDRYEGDGGTPIIRILDIVDGKVNVGQLEIISPTQSQEYQRTIVNEGDLIISVVGTIGRSLIISPELKSTNLSRALARIQLSNRFFVSFINYFIQSTVFISYTELIPAGTAQKVLNLCDLGNLPFTIPKAIEEQRAIADYLGQETAHIDAHIAKKQRLIELLKEKRTALITQAVTKGLDPSVPMKDSGIEWLGEVPEHWEVTQLRRAILKFVDYRGKTPKKVDSGIPLITAGAIKNGSVYFNKAEAYIDEADYDSWMVRGLPRRGDVLVTTEAPLGETAQIQDENIALAQRIILLKTKKEMLLNVYLKYYWLSQAGQGELGSQATGSTALGIKASKFKGCNILIPSLSEQRAIAAFLDRETERIDALVAKVEEGIEKFKEYRMALITAMVTGKIDVRGEE